MKKMTMVAAVAAVTVGGVMASASAHAQDTALEVWQPPEPRQADPAKRVPQAQQPVAGAGEAQGVVPGSGVQPQAYRPAMPADRGEHDRGGFFVGVQAGKGWVYEDVDQSAVMINAGYRWQAGPVTLVGIEAAGGQLNGTWHNDGYYGEVDYASLGANTRFNFGLGSPVYGLVRGGYWSANSGYAGTVDGGYFGVGLGVDFNRHFNMSLVYTNHVYFENYYWDDGYEINSAETLMLGLEARF